MAKLSRNFLVFFLVLIFTCGKMNFLWGQTENEWTGEKIIRWGLIFSMCEENSEAWNQSIENYRNLYESCLNENVQEMDEYDRGEKLLFLLYENVLKKYSLKQTKIDTALLEGTYNCVSSSILYLALAEDFNLDARVQQTEQHAFLIVYLADGRKITVETTNPYGFDPGRVKVLEESEAVKKYVSIPKTHYSNKKEISVRRALTLIERNLCSAFILKNNYEDSIPLAALAYDFVQEENEKKEARSELDLLAGNKAALLSQKNQNQEAMDFLEEIYEKYGKSEKLQDYYDSAAYNSSVYFCNHQDYKGAREDFEKRKNNISEKISREILQNINEGEIYYKATELCNEEKFLEAAELCDQGLKEVPSSSYLKQFKKNCLINHGKMIHNQAAVYVNSGNKKKALEILEKGLRENPDSLQIKNDIKKLKGE